MVDKKAYWIMWLKAAGVRAVKTFAQALISVIGTGVIGIMEVNWPYALSVAVMAAVLSMLTSLAGLPEITLPDDDIIKTLDTIEKEE